MKQAHPTTAFADALECYEAIGRWLNEEAAEPWEQIAVEFTILEMDDVSEQVIRYKPSRSIRRRHKQFFIADTRFEDCFFALAKLTSTPEKGFFKKCRFILAGTGQYKVDFDY